MVEFRGLILLVVVTAVIGVGLGWWVGVASNGTSLLETGWFLAIVLLVAAIVVASWFGLDEGE